LVLVVQGRVGQQQIQDVLFYISVIPGQGVTTVTVQIHLPV